MKRGSIRRWTIAVAAALASLAAWPAAGWTAKPVRFVVTGPPGGSSDVLARIVGEALSAQIGQPVVVDNKPGGGGAIAVNALLAAAPDGQTLLVGAQNVLTEVPLVLKVGFDPLRDLKPVAVDRTHRPGARRQPERAGREPEGARRVRQGESRQAELRVLLAGHRLALRRPRC